MLILQAQLCQSHFKKLICDLNLLSLRVTILLGGTELSVSGSVKNLYPLLQCQTSMHGGDKKPLRVSEFPHGRKGYPEGTTNEPKIVS